MIAIRINIVRDIRVDLISANGIKVTMVHIDALGSKHVRIAAVSDIKGFG
jgi:hypothetical protein